MGSGEDGVRLWRRGGWFYAVWSDPEKGTQRRALRTKDRAVADRQLADYEKILKSTPKDTVGQIMEAYMNDRDEIAASPGRIRDAWKRLQPTFGNLRPDQIDRPLCRAYRRARKGSGAGDGTIRTELQYLRAGLRFNNKSTPAIVELPPKPAPKDRTITHAEHARLVEAALHPHMKLYIELAGATAGRPQAILQLTWKQIDFDRRIIRLGDGTRRVKGRATVPIKNRLLRMLEEAREGALSDYVIEWAGDKVKSIKKGFASAAASAGLKNVTPYVLRHSAAVWMAEAGIPMAEIAQFLGHEDSKITEQVYAKFSPEHLRKAAEALP